MWPDESVRDDFERTLNGVVPTRAYEVSLSAEIRVSHDLVIG